MKKVYNWIVADNTGSYIMRCSRKNQLIEDRIPRLKNVKIAVNNYKIILFA